MATKSNVQTVSLISGADLSAIAKRNTIVKLSADKTVVQSTSGTEKHFGVLQNCPKSGEAASVAIGGIVKIVASAGINVGDAVTSAADGKAVATTTAGNFVIGYAVTTVANANEIVEVKIDNTRVPA